MTSEEIAPEDSCFALASQISHRPPCYALRGEGTWSVTSSSFSPPWSTQNSWNFRTTGTAGKGHVPSTHTPQTSTSTKRVACFLCRGNAVWHPFGSGERLVYQAPQHFLHTGDCGLLFLELTTATLEPLLAVEMANLGRIQPHYSAGYYHSVSIAPKGSKRLGFYTKKPPVFTDISYNTHPHTKSCCILLSSERKYPMLDVKGTPLSRH